MRSILLVLAFILSAIGQASGWNCESESTRSGFPHAKIVNFTTKPRIPAIFVVSGKEMGTLLTARNNEIDKTNLTHGVQYEATLKGVTGILYIKYREGVDDPLENGEPVSGKLTLIENQTTHHYEMSCARYLKTP